MELVALANEMLQNAAEFAASYRIGQIALKQADRVLWVIEKTARWALPPALDQDSAQPPERIRPLPWVLFFSLLVVLRITRESLSLINLTFGKPSVGPADVVIYIQSKRRYLRALKYQGNRNMRSRVNRPSQKSQWLSNLQSLFEFTACYKRQPVGSVNNNNSDANNTDEILIVKRSKRKRDSQEKQASGENIMDRFIEKMADMYGDSSDDSDYTVTNATSTKTDSSITSDEENYKNGNTKMAASDNGIAFSTPIKSSTGDSRHLEDISAKHDDTFPLNGPSDITASPSEIPISPSEIATFPSEIASSPSNLTTSPAEVTTATIRHETEVFLHSEQNTQVDKRIVAEKSPTIANGKASRSNNTSRDGDTPVVRITSADTNSKCGGRKEGDRQEIYQS